MGVDSATQAITQYVQSAGRATGNYNRHLAAEQAKDKPDTATGKNASNNLSTPSLKGSATAQDVVFGAGKKGAGKGKGKGRKNGRKSAEDIATGGRRSTSITMNISKFFDTLHVHMIDKADTAELERIVVQSMNRALAIATSTDRG